MSSADCGLQPREIRIFIVAEVRLYEEGLAQALDREPRFAVVGTASSVGAGIECMRRLVSPPEVALIDLHGTSGRHAVATLHEGLPSVLVIALGIKDAEPDVLPWAEAGVDGFVSTDASLEDLMNTVDSVCQGETLCSPRMAAALLRHVATLARQQGARPSQPILTARERQIAGLIDQGMSNKEIATSLRIELPTVKNHVHNLLEKLGVQRRAEAAAVLRGERRDYAGSRR